ITVHGVARQAGQLFVSPASFVARRKHEAIVLSATYSNRAIREEDAFDARADHWLGALSISGIVQDQTRRLEAIARAKGGGETVLPPVFWITRNEVRVTLAAHCRGAVRR